MTPEFIFVKPLNPFLGQGPKGVRSHLAIYETGNLAITAWVYLPPENYDGAPRGMHPLEMPAPDGGAIIAGHGGVDGIPAHYDVVLRRLAASGWTVAAPSYRGESGGLRGGDGEIEFALGEVDDMKSCWKIVSSMPGIDPKQTWLLGSSHGAMINLLLLGRDDCPPEIPGARCLAGVYDLPKWYDWMTDTNHFFLEEAFIQHLMSQDLKINEKRSAMNIAEKIKAPVFLLHGENDTLVPVEQTSDLVQKFIESGKTNHRVRFDPGMDHEYIWAPDRPESSGAWKSIFEFMSEFSA